MEVGDRAGADGIAGSEGRGGMLVSTSTPTSQQTPWGQAHQLRSLAQQAQGTAEEGRTEAAPIDPPGSGLAR